MNLATGTLVLACFGQYQNRCPLGAGPELVAGPPSCKSGKV